MKEMTTHERMSRMYAHQEADRVPVTDAIWSTTIERWHREGMPEHVSAADFFGLDKIAHIGVDNSPRYPARVIEETDDYVITTTAWGATLKTGSTSPRRPSLWISKSMGPTRGRRPKPG